MIARITNKYLRSIYIHTYNNIKNIINEYKYAYSYNNMPGISS